MSVSKDDLADNFNWSAKSPGMRDGMTSEIIGPQIYTRQLARFFDHHPGSKVGVKILIIAKRLHSSHSTGFDLATEDGLS